MRAGERISIGSVARLDVPHRRIVVSVQQRLIVTLGYGVPTAQLFRLHQPAHEGACLLPHGREAENRMADRVKQMEATLRSRRVHGLVGDFADFGKFALGKPQDALGFVCAINLFFHPRLMLTALLSDESCPAIHALFLLTSVQPSTSASIVSLKNLRAKSTARAVSAESMTTVFPSAATSAPPYDHSSG